MALPVTPSMAKQQLRIDGDDEDDQIAQFILDAAAWVEDYTGHVLEPRDIVQYCKSGRPFALRAWPVGADAVPIVAYVDASGQDATVDDAWIDRSGRPYIVRPAIGMAWPVLGRDRSFAVTIRVGYENPDDVPQSLVRAMLILISAYDADREGGEAMQLAVDTARTLCRKFKAHTL